MAVAIAVAGILLVRASLRAPAPDFLARLGRRGSLAGMALVVVAVFVAAAPFVVREQGKRCIREETSNILVGRVSQARLVCVEYGDASATGTRSTRFAIRYDPEDPTREAPFAIVVAGLDPGESVRVSISPLGVLLQPATLAADAAGEARTDFRIPNGASPEWVVVAQRASGESVTSQVPLPPAGSDPLGRVPRPTFAPPTPDPTVTVSTCSPSPAPVRTRVLCTFVGLTGPYANFSRTNLGTGETLDLRFLDVVRTDGRAIYAHTYWVDPGEYQITATTPTGTTATARFAVTPG